MKDNQLINNEAKTKNAKFLKKYLKRIVSITLFFTVLYILWTGVFIHDWHLRQFSNEYDLVQHPAGTKRIKSYRELGSNVGSGDYCDYFAGDLRSYTGSRKQLLKYYSSKNVWNPIAKKYIPLEVVFLDYETKSRTFTHGTILLFMIDSIATDAKKLAKPSEQLYIVFMRDDGNDKGLDIRCF